MIVHGTILLTREEATAVEQRRNQVEEVAEAEVTKGIVATLVVQGRRARVLQERPHRVPDLPKAQGPVAEAADGATQEGKPHGHLPEAVLLGDPQASPLPTQDRYVEIACREHVTGNLRTASFGIPTLHVL